MFGGQGFVAGAEAHPAQVGQFEGEGLDFDVFVVDFRRVILYLVEQVLNGAGDPIRECGIGVEARQFRVQIHAGIIPDKTA